MSKKYISIEKLGVFLESLKGLFSQLGHNHNESYHTKQEIETKVSTINSDILKTQGNIDSHAGNGDIHFTTSERTKLSGIESGAQKNTVIGVKGGAESTYRVGQVDITASNIGLGNVNNTSDVNKPVSSAQQAAIDSSASSTLTSAKTYAKNYADSLNSAMDSRMDAAESKLSGIDDGANKTVVDSALSSSSTNPVQNKVVDSALSGKVPVSRTINGKGLSSDIILSASDVDAYSKDEIDGEVSSINASIGGKENAGVASSLVSSHNTNGSAHNDIRDLITGLSNRLNAVANSTDEDLDTLAEIVDYIKSNKNLIDSVTTTKVNVSDIINNLTTNVSNKPLSAAQGVAIKSLIDALQDEVDAKQPTITGAATTITSNNLTANRALISNGSGKVAISDITSTELGYLDGVSSNIQSQLDSKAPSHSHPYAGSSTQGGSATSAVKLDSSAGTATQPIWFEDGKPKATTYALNKTVPSNAVFTDTNHTYDFSASAGSTNGNVKLNLIAGGSGSGTDSVTIKGTGGASVTTDSSGVVTVNAPSAYSHPDSVTSGTISGSSGSVSHGGTISIPSITYNAGGHITSTTTTSVTLPSAYSLPNAGTSLGGVKSGGDVTISAGVITVNDDSHAHVISNVDGLQSELDGKAPVNHNHTGLQAVTTSGTGAAYTATVSGITSLTKGVNFIMIPHTSSTTKTPTLNVNGLGAKTIQRYVSANDYSTEGYNESWLQSTRPVLVIYSGTYWYVQAMDKPAAYDLRGTVPVASGGTGATNAVTALANLGITMGTTAAPSTGTPNSIYIQLL